MADIIPIASRAPIKRAFVPRQNNDDLAQIGTPELIHSNALIEIRHAAIRLASIKPGEAGEYEAIHEVMKVFRGPDWEAMICGGQDDGA